MRPLPSALRLCLALLALTIPAFGATITVDKAKGQTIQQGVDAAADGDTVLVSPGTYFEHVDFKGKAITVTSTLSTDPATTGTATQTTIIDGSSTGPAVTSSPKQVNGGSTGSANATLSYFTIQNGGSPISGGTAASYGGVYLQSYTPMGLVGNIITHNNFGGVSVGDGGFGYLMSNTITENTCWGIIAVSGSMVVIQNEISATQTPATGCTITDAHRSFATNSSGILLDGDTDGSGSQIYANTIEDNVQVPSTGAPIEGGAGIVIYAGGAIIQNNIIRNNFAPFARGGAIDIASSSNIEDVASSATIAQNVIYKNQAGCGGAAIAFDFSGLNFRSGNSNNETTYSLVVANNTIADNTASTPPAACSNDPQSGTQIDADDQGLASPAVLFVNNVISARASTPVINCSQQAVPSIYNQAVFDHNLLFNAGGAIFGSACVDESVNGLLGNIVADPQFMNSDTGDYRLRSSSPGIDSGNNGVVLTIATQFSVAYPFHGGLYTMGSSPSSLADILDNPRVQDATSRLDGTGAESDVIDMGAYELSGTVASDNPLTLIIRNAALPANPGPATLSAYISDGTQQTGTNPPVAKTIVPSGTVTFFIDGAQAADPAPIASTPTPLEIIDVIGVAYASVNFTPGVHVITATYQPAPKVDATQAVAQVVEISDTPTALSLTADPYKTLIGNAVTFTVTAQPTASGYVLSPISLLDIITNQVIGTITPDKTTGIGTLTTTTLPLGYTVAEATFEGHGTYAPTISNEVSVDITSATGLTLTSALNPALAFTPFNLTAQFDPLAGAPASGFVTFSAISTQPGSFSQDIGRATTASGTATRAVTLPAGTYDITATYAGDATHGSSISAALPETVLGVATTLTLESNLNPALAFQPIPLTAHLSTTANAPADSLTGSISFLANGKALGTAAIDAGGNAEFIANLPAGTYSLTASFAGNASFAASLSAAVSEVVNRDNTATILTVTPNPGYTPGENETLTGAVTPASSTVLPGGAVAFYDNGQPIGVGQSAPAQGAPLFASLNTSTLAAGVHTLTASYSGDANFLPSNSAPITLNIVLRDFSITADPSITIETQHHNDLNVTLASLGNLTGTIQLTCANLPAYTSCNPTGPAPSLTADATLATTIDIDTDAAIGFESGLRRSPGIRNAIALALLFPITLLAARRRLKGLTLSLFAAVALFALTAFTGCSGHYPDHTPPGTYTFTLTGTSAVTGLSHSTQVTLLVTK